MTKKNEQGETDVKDAAPVSSNTPTESVYTAKELALAAKSRFHTVPEVVVATLFVNGLQETTISNAEKLIKEFLERKVK